MTDSHRVLASTLLEDIIPHAAENDKPVTVVDEQGNIIGCIDRGQLLQGLSRGHSS